MPTLQNTASCPRPHGLTAQDLVLPTEDAAAFEARRADWHAAYRPDDPAQLLLVDRAVHASWRLDRCAKAEAARLSTRILHAAVAAAPQVVVPPEAPSAVVEPQAGSGSSSHNEPNPAPPTASPPSRPRFERLVEMQANGT